MPETLISYLRGIGFSAHDSKFSNTVFKQGRTTGSTHAQRHAPRAVTRTYKTKAVVLSVESVVVPDVDAGRFAYKGDSGSFVYNGSGAPEGVIWGGNTSDSADEQGKALIKPTTVDIARAVYVTPLDAILRHVQARLDGEFNGKFQISLVQ